MYNEYCFLREWIHVERELRPSFVRLIRLPGGWRAGWHGITKKIWRQRNDAHDLP